MSGARWPALVLLPIAVVPIAAHRAAACRRRRCCWCATARYSGTVSGLLYIKQSWCGMPHPVVRKRQTRSTEGQNAAGSHTNCATLNYLELAWDHTRHRWHKNGYSGNGQAGSPTYNHYCPKPTTDCRLGHQTFSIAGAVVVNTNREGTSARLRSEATLTICCPTYGVSLYSGKFPLVTITGISRHQD